MIWYIETSAFLKLLVQEEHSDELRTWFASHGPCWSSELLRTESMRAATRLGIDPESVREALETISLVLPAASTFQVAGTLEPGGLRSLDALHLASALELGGDLTAIVSYDGRVVEGARDASISVLSP